MNSASVRTQRHHRRPCRLPFPQRNSEEFKIGCFEHEACAERPLHLVERALRARFCLWIENRKSDQANRCEMATPPKRPLTWVIRPLAKQDHEEFSTKQSEGLGGVNGPTRPNMRDTSLLISCSGTLQAGSEVNETVLNLDKLPAVLGLLKIKPPAEVRHNGQDFTPLLFGARDARWRTEMFGQYDLHNSGLAYMRMLRTNDWKLVRYYHSNGLDELCHSVAD